MDNLEKTKKKRKSHRGTTTKLLNKVEDALAKEEKDQLRLQQLLADLKDKAEVLKALDGEIFELMIEEADDDACDKEAEEARKA
eukprot:gene9041-16684_t